MYVISCLDVKDEAVLLKNIFYLHFYFVMPKFEMVQKNMDGNREVEGGFLHLYGEKLQNLGELKLVERIVPGGHHICTLYLTIFDMNPSNYGHVS